MYQSWLDDDPAWGWGWIGWADCYTPYGPGKTQDYARAEEILRRGYAVTGVREAEDIAGRLADICGRTGRPGEAREFRQQAEKDRRRAGRATAWAAPTVPAGEPRAAKQYPAGKTGRNQPCPCVGMSGQVRPARFAGPSLNTPQPLLAAGCGVPWVGL